MRPATDSDLTALDALEDVCFGSARWSPKALAEAVAGKADRRVDVAALDGSVVGFVVVRIGADTADLERIAVAPEHRRSGIGEALLSFAVARADACGVTVVLLEVCADNQVAIDFYSHHGFSEIDRRRRYYHGRADAVVMVRRAVG